MGAHVGAELFHHTGRAQHDDEIGHLAGFVEADEIHAEQSIFADTGGELEG
jgi:hypothetical protein